MLLYRILTAIFLFCVSVIWAGSFAQVVLDTYALTLNLEALDYEVQRVTNTTPVAAAVMSPLP